jgi:type IV pilus assembly protein PilV
MNGLDHAAAKFPAFLDRAPGRLVRKAVANGVRERRRPATAASRWQAGVGLIEVLVAVLVLSIGFLGIAALQAMSMSTNNSAMARSMATIDSYSILDAMRADRANALGSSYNGTITADACPAAAGSLATTQLTQWCTQLGHDLGAVATTTGAISCAASGECTVTITFDDSRAGAGGTNKQKVITKGIL